MSSACDAEDQCELDPACPAYPACYEIGDLDDLPAKTPEQIRAGYAAHCLRYERAINGHG